MTFAYFSFYLFCVSPEEVRVPHKDLVESVTFHANLYYFIQFCVYKLDEFNLVVQRLQTYFLSKNKKITQIHQLLVLKSCKSATPTDWHLLYFCFRRSCLQPLATDSSFLSRSWLSLGVRNLVPVNNTHRYFLIFFLLSRLFRT